MSVKTAETARAPSVPGLSRETQSLWLAAQRYRRLADLAASKVAQ